MRGRSRARTCGAAGARGRIRNGRRWQGHGAVAVRRSRPVADARIVRPAGRCSAPVTSAEASTPGCARHVRRAWPSIPAPVPRREATDGRRNGRHVGGGWGRIASRLAGAGDAAACARRWAWTTRGIGDETSGRRRWGREVRASSSDALRRPARTRLATAHARRRAPERACRAGTASAARRGARGAGRGAARGRRRRRQCRCLRRAGRPPRRA